MAFLPSTYTLPEILNLTKWLKHSNPHNLAKYESKGTLKIPISQFFSEPGNLEVQSKLNIPKSRFLFTSILELGKKKNDL